MKAASTWAASRIEAWQLQPHPEGGFYREIYRSGSTLPLPRGQRALVTAIHFVLPPGAVSAWHRVRADEVWTLVDGDPIDLATLDDVGVLCDLPLGRDPGAGESPVRVVAAGLWQAARSLGERGSHAVCVVAPGFDFRDFVLGSADALAATWPAHVGRIRSFVR